MNRSSPIPSCVCCHRADESTGEEGVLSPSLITMLSVRKLFLSSSPSCGGRPAVRTGCHAASVDLCTTRRPYGGAHGPPINKQMKGSPRRSAELSWPICGGPISGLTEIQNGHTLCLTVRRLLTLSSVMGKRTGTGKVGAKKRREGA